MLNLSSNFLLYKTSAIYNFPKPDRFRKVAPHRPTDCFIVNLLLDF